MAKSSKKSKAASAQENRSIVTHTEIRNGDSLSQPGLVEPKSKEVKAAKAMARPKRAADSAPRKSPVRGKTRAGESKAFARKVVDSISDDEIRLRAYFLSERRMREGLPGDSGHDWLEARRQLMAEAEARP